MTNKKGFLLIELAIGLLLFTYFTIMVAHYTVKLKKTLHSALKKIEILSFARNLIEKQKATKNNDAYKSYHGKKYIISHTIGEKMNPLSDNHWNIILISENIKSNKEMIKIMYMETKTAEQTI